jgi:hypothetical protein
MGPMDAAWAEGLMRLAELNGRARLERLRRLTLDDGLRESEAHCAEMHEAFEPFEWLDRPKSHPVGLIKLWKHP